MRMARHKNKLDARGFTIMEIMITTLILLPALVSVMYGLLKCVELNELSRHTSQAVWAVRNKLSEIENTPFDQINATYDNVTFTANGLNGIGVGYVDDSQASILEVTATFCWREKNGRIIGEDTDLDGQIDAGEDVNANGVLDSPVVLRTVFYDA